MQIGICANDALLAQLPANAGHDFVEDLTQEVLLPERPDADFATRAALLRRSGQLMPASNRFLPADLKVVGPTIDRARLERYAANVFRRAQEVGMNVIVFGSAAARQAPEGWSGARAFEQYVEALKLFAPFAATHGVQLVVEPLWRGECNVVNTVLEGAEAVRRADHSAVRLLVDSFHIVRNGESFDDILKIAPVLRHAHISEDRDRAPMGTYGDDLRPFLRALHRAGYAGRLTLEPVWGDIAAQAAPCVAELRKQIAEAT
jgi:sugar phosphate isomerase/epimerase